MRRLTMTFFPMLILVLSPVGLARGDEVLFLNGDRQRSAPLENLNRCLTRFLLLGLHIGKIFGHVCLTFDAGFVEIMVSEAGCHLHR